MRSKAAENRILVRIMNSFGVERPSATNQTITSHHVVKRKLVTISISYPQIDLFLRFSAISLADLWLVQFLRALALSIAAGILLDKCFSTIFIATKNKRSLFYVQTFDNEQNHIFIYTIFFGSPFFPYIHRRSWHCRLSSSSSLLAFMQQKKKHSRRQFDAMPQFSSDGTFLVFKWQWIEKSTRT